MAARDDFVERYSQILADLPQDVKAVFDVVDDAELPESGRVLAAGALVSLLQAGDLIPDTFGPLGLVDDAVTLRLAADLAVPADHARRAAHAERHPEFWSTLAEDLALARSVFGDTFALFEARSRRLGSLEHKGRRAAVAVKDERAATWLFEEVDEAMTELEMDDGQLPASLRRIDQAVAIMRKRLMRR